MLRKYFKFLFLPILLFSEELEVKLPTRTQLPLLYLSQVKTESTTPDWRYLEELRAVLEFDLAHCGYCTLVSPQIEWEETISSTNVKKNFDLPFWKSKKIPYVLAIESPHKEFTLVAFQIEKGTSKRYPGFTITENLERDRKELHQLADAVQKDLFGAEGIASLQFIYTQRWKHPEGKSTDWLSEIWIADVDGGNPKRILRGTDYCVSPNFFPTETSDFFFVSYKNGQSKIYRANSKDPKPEPMIALRGSQLLPAISKSGRQIAFIADAAGRPDLFIQNIDSTGKMIGKARQLFSAPRATQASPTFSPDGKHIAFVSDKDGPARIYTLETASATDTKKPNPRLLTKKNRENTSPSWSPDGKKLAYSAKTEGVRQIWIYDFQTDTETQLTDSPENKENPSWAPDSFHLLYNTENEDLCEIYRINLQQKEPLLLLKGPEQKRFPSWQMK